MFSFSQPRHSGGRARAVCRQSASAERNVPRTPSADCVRHAHLKAQHRSTSMFPAFSRPSHSHILQTPGSFHSDTVHHLIMPRPNPHALALFSLQADSQSERAKYAVAHPSNAHLTSRLDDGTLALDIGHVYSLSGARNTLTVLGRDGGSDIVMEGSSIAKSQCSFEIDPFTGIVMFCDRSFGQTSQVYGENATPFEINRHPRSVVVHPKLNTIIGMGGEKRNLFLFRLVWHCSGDETRQKVEDRANTSLEENPRIARTVAGADIVSTPGRETRLHMTEPRQPEVRYARLDKIGSGQFGNVYKAIDADSGRLMAIKI
jgi:hypothetical protein